MKNNCKSLDIVEALAECIAKKLFEFIKNEKLLTTPSLSDSDKKLAKELFAHIDQEVERFELFLEPRLSLRQVSKFTGLNEKEVSWAINTTLNQSFSSYINNKRILFFKAQVSSGLVNRKNILSWALKSGFNSKSSFNLFFKESTGCTPSEYLKNKCN